MGNHEKQDPEFVEVSSDHQREEGHQSNGPRRLIEMVLDPRTLQGLMLLGGGLLVLGLVVWLWSIGVFENRLVVASCLAVGNAALLLAGVAGVRFTRYQTASRAVTLLGCLVMPLNLWFYDAQGLVTLDQGGHLWVPALVCCGIYVAVARVLANPLFVHAIVGGITMTGLLFLADRQVGHFWEITSPSSFLVVLGMICIHLERAFPVGKSAFSRDRFGWEFFRAGHVVMGLGLVVLFVGRLCGRLYDPFLAEWGLFEAPIVATQANLKLLALGLALCGAYSYVYSQIVVRAQGRYLASAALALLWSGVILLDVLAIPFTMELLLLLISLGALATAIAARFSQRNISPEAIDNKLTWITSFSNSVVPLSIGLNLATVGLGIALYCRVRFDVLSQLMPYEFGLMFLAAMILCSVSCWLGLRVAQRSSKAAQWHLHGLVVASLLAVVAAMSCLGVTFSIATLALEMAIPLVVAGVSVAAQSEEKQRVCSKAAQLAAALVLIVGIGVALGLVSAATVGQPHLWLAVLFGEAAVCFGLASVHDTRITPSVLAALSVCAATWQLLMFLDITQHTFIIATSIVGLISLVAAEFSTSLRKEVSKFATVSLWTGRLFVSYGGAATMLLSFSRLMADETNWALVGLLLAQIVVSVAAALLSRQPVWRRYFLVMAVGEILLSMVVVNSLSVLGLWQRVELLLTVAGLVALAAGYFGWYREDESKQDIVSFNLAAGSLLSAVPLTIGLVIQRFSDSKADWGWMFMHESGVLAIGMLLLGAGILCRIRWSTLVGGCSTLVYVVSLVGLIQLPDQLQTTAITMMVGGGLFFGGAVLLSVYRDRLLELPQKIQEGEGVFRVFKWR